METQDIGTIYKSKQQSSPTATTTHPEHLYALNPEFCTLQSLLSFWNHTINFLMNLRLTNLNMLVPATREYYQQKFTSLVYLHSFRNLYKTTE